MGASPNKVVSEGWSGMEAGTDQKDDQSSSTQRLEAVQREKKKPEHLTWRAVDGLLVSLAAETQSIDHLKKGTRRVARSVV